MSANIDMDTLDQKGKHDLHAVIVPFPAQGDINVFVNLAQLLVIRGLFVTFVNTEWIHKRMMEASKDANSLVSRDHPELDQPGQRIRFLSIPDGLPPDHGRTSNPGELLFALQKLGPALEELLRSTEEKSAACPPITFIVTDAFMSCTEQVASNMKVPRVIFWPLRAACSVSQCYVNLLLSEGHIPVNAFPVTLHGLPDYGLHLAHRGAVGQPPPTRPGCLITLIASPRYSLSRRGTSQSKLQVGGHSPLSSDGECGMTRINGCRSSTWLITMFGYIKRNVFLSLPDFSTEVCSQLWRKLAEEPSSTTA